MPKTTRVVDKVAPGKPTLEGAGVNLKRAIGPADVPRLDPFLLLDDFHSNNPADYVAGFPWHPHRGIETVTYMIRGVVEHGDSIGNKGTIASGDVQWMTAGSGIIHQEMPQEYNGMFQGFQLWVNLPAADKMMQPRYRGITKEQIPSVTSRKGVAVKVIAGKVGHVQGPVKDLVVDAEYLDVEIQPGREFERAIRKGHRAFAYVFEGHGFFDPKQHDPVSAENLVIFQDGDNVEVKAGTETLRFLLVSGKPIGEPVAWRGPIVMNTEQELQRAFEEYWRGTFIKSV